jgi:hypothetical protein
VPERLGLTPELISIKLVEVPAVIDEEPTQVFPETSVKTYVP